MTPPLFHKVVVGFANGDALRAFTLAGCGTVTETEAQKLYVRNGGDTVIGFRALIQLEVPMGSL